MGDLDAFPDHLSHGRRCTRHGQVTADFDLGGNGTNNNAQKKQGCQQLPTKPDETHLVLLGINDGAVEVERYIIKPLCYHKISFSQRVGSF